MFRKTCELNVGWEGVGGYTILVSQLCAVTLCNLGQTVYDSRYMYCVQMKMQQAVMH